MKQITWAMNEQTKSTDRTTDNFKNVTEQASEVTMATKVQAREVEELRKHIEDINNVVNLNVRDVQKTSSITRELSEYTLEIKKSLEELVE
ncbi:methyl-accepting chemotaxis protein [Clostridium beijerinckii]|jgi:methyl-accepting chemotaxis protein|nr:hypothetical protein [Clostridium beijerinckii]NOW89553.1 methyl-accepting chemotaxis protein [Clostridium beijerinckii]